MIEKRGGGAVFGGGGGRDNIYELIMVMEVCDINTSVS